jgi:hypothetical protein
LTGTERLVTEGRARSVRKTVVAFAATFCVLVLALHGMHRPSFRGDGVGYYAFAASVLFDGDLDLRNELEHLDRSFLRAAFLTPEGRLGDPFPVGPAILWSPAVLIARQLPPNAAYDAPTRVRTRTLHPAFAPRYARAVLWTNVLLVLVGGTLLAATLAVHVHWFAAWMASLGAVFATPLHFYMLAEPSYGHAPSFFAIALLVSAVLVDRRRPLRLELLGLAVGIAALVRVQDIVFAGLLLPRLLDEWTALPSGTRRQRGLGVVRVAARVGIPAALAFAPQMIVWAQLYGRPLLVPPGPDFGAWWRPALPQFLFSAWNSVLLWAPLMLAGIAGWACWRDVRLRRAVWVVVAVEIYLCAVLLDWWGGAAFGPRRFVSVAPLVACGLAALLDRAHRPLARSAAAVAVVLLSAASVRMAQYTARGLLVYNPADGQIGRWDYVGLARALSRAEDALQSRE